MSDSHRLHDTQIGCPWCGEAIEILLDPSGGTTQEWVEDCSVCCRPIVFEVRVEDGAPHVVRCRREGEE